MEWTNVEVLLSQYGACRDGLKWAQGRTLGSVWYDCPRGDWLLWLAGKLGADTRSLVLSAAACARLSLKFVPEDEDRPRKAIEAAEAWANAPSEENRRSVAEASRAASRAAAWAAAAAASRAAEAAAWAAAAAASRAAEAAAWAAAAAEAEDIHSACASEVRKIISYDSILALAKQSLECTR